MTIAIVLRPDFTSTFSRGILRIAGTLAGLLLATGLFHLFAPGRTKEIALLALFVFILRWVGPANYGVFVTAVSAFIVIFIAITGVPPADVVAARGVNTLIGGAFALLAYVVWPTWENRRAGSVFADLLDADRAYFLAVVDAYKDSSPAVIQRIHETGMKARLARTNAEAFVGRISAEPALPPARARLFRAMLVTLHGFVRSVLAIESALDQPVRQPPRQSTLEFASQVATILQAMSTVLRSGQRLAQHLPDLREAHNRILASTEVPGEQYTLINTETDRIATSLNTLLEEISQLAGDVRNAASASEVQPA